MKQRYAVGMTMAAGLLVLSGCAQIKKVVGNEESVNYKSTVAGQPLSIPPDLTQANEDAHYKAPAGTTTYSQYQQNQEAQKALGPSDKILPATNGVQVMRDGDLRWLEIDQPAQNVYPKVVDFWGHEGFTIRSQDPKAGLIQTDWAENRAKIPESWIRSALGSIIDQVYDSGERDRFRTRIERVNGKTEVYISHEHMVETPTADGAAFKWVYGKEDQGLNAAMLARLMVFMGTDVKQARTLVAQAEKDPSQPTVTQAPTGQAEVKLNESFDRAWRRVGVAIDAAGFSVVDRDRSSGDYFIRYLDTDTGRKLEESNFLTRMFGAKDTTEAASYRIHVAQEGAGSTVTVLDKNGQRDNSPTAQRIVTVLGNHMK
ncbi:outer membrane protein assembly factor BamC [Candidimonas nitroreducens]|nr:outer membrane protein assembly factor BamC [Candidimonas nitroreducens]